MHSSRMQIMSLCPYSIQRFTKCSQVFWSEQGLHSPFLLMAGFHLLPFFMVCWLSPPSPSCSGILEELCVVLASYWSMLAPGEIEVSEKKCVCGVGLIFLDTKNVWKNEVRQRNACKSHTSPEFPEKQQLESTKQYVRKYQKRKMYNRSF